MIDGFRGWFCCVFHGHRGISTTEDIPCSTAHTSFSIQCHCPCDWIGTYDHNEKSRIPSTLPAYPTKG